jgi:hypothetical protein
VTTTNYNHHCVDGERLFWGCFIIATSRDGKFRVSIWICLVAVDPLPFSLIRPLEAPLLAAGSNVYTFPCVKGLRYAGPWLRSQRLASNWRWSCYGSTEKVDSSSSVVTVPGGLLGAETWTGESDIFGSSTQRRERAWQQQPSGSLLIRRRPSRASQDSRSKLRSYTTLISCFEASQDRRKVTTITTFPSLAASVEDLHETFRREMLSWWARPSLRRSLRHDTFSPLDQRSSGKYRRLLLLVLEAAGDAMSLARQ